MGQSSQGVMGGCGYAAKVMAAHCVIAGSEERKAAIGLCGTGERNPLWPPGR